MAGLVGAPQRDAARARQVPVRAEVVGQPESIEREQDVGRQALTEALGGRVARLRDDDVEVRRQPQADRGGQPGRPAADDEDVTAVGDQPGIALPLPQPLCGVGLALNGHSATTLTDWPSVGSLLSASRKKSGG